MNPSKSLQSVRPSYIREILTESKKPGVISLAGGLPATELLPVKLFAEALCAISNDPLLLQYGETQGYPPLVQHLQRDTLANQKTLITSGAQQGLDLVARSFINPHDIIVVEAPCYLGALQVFGLAQATIMQVTQQHDGPNIEQLQRIFDARNVKFFYGVPDFHNPTGVNWSVEKRQQVARLCLKYNVFFIEDSPYRALCFNGKAQPKVSDMCAEKSIFLRSFSKSVAPGIRVGSVSAPADIVKALIKTKQAADLHTSLPMQAALLRVLQHSEYSSYLQAMRANYACRYTHLRDQLGQLLDLGCDFNDVNGGMFVWLTLPPLNDMQFARDLLKFGVSVVPGRVFYANDVPDINAVRINFTYCSKAELTSAVAQMARVLTQHER